MNTQADTKFPSTDTVLNTLMVGGTVLSVTFLAIAQSVPSLVA